MTTTTRTSIGGYARHLADRNGTPDSLDRTLANREAFFDRLRADEIRAEFRPDADEFIRLMQSRRAAPDLDPRLTWLVATAKLNQAERYGVGLSELRGRNQATLGAPEELVFIELEEHYHTRTLAYVLEMFGLPYISVLPTPALRLFMNLTTSIPDRYMLPLVGAAEMAGCVLFREMRDAGRRLFADDPAVAERIGVLYDDILSDEIGHVGFCSAQLGEGRRRWMRRLYRPVASMTRRNVPEFDMLIGDRLDAVFDGPFPLDDLVDELGSRAYVAAAI